ncbi:1937_t:CDS:2, partial [Paraglomus occultum]
NPQRPTTPTWSGSLSRTLTPPIQKPADTFYTVQRRPREKTCRSQRNQVYNHRRFAEENGSGDNILLIE